MAVVVFEARGPTALFRKPYALMSPVSYPAPPPTAVFGLVGAIAGFGKDEYLARIGERVRVAVRLLRPIRKFSAGLNLIDTREARYFRRKKPAAGVKGLAHIQIPHEFVRDAAYRIYFWHDDPEVVRPLVEQLEAGKTAYTPCLGLAQCIASIDHRGVFEAVERVPQEPVDIVSVVPLGEGTRVHYSDTGHYVRYRVAARMTPERVVTRYDEVVVETEAQALNVEVSRYFEVDGDPVLFQ